MFCSGPPNISDRSSSDCDLLHYIQYTQDELLPDYLDRIITRK